MPFEDRRAWFQCRKITAFGCTVVSITTRVRSERLAGFGLGRDRWLSCNNERGGKRVAVQPNLERAAAAAG